VRKRWATYLKDTKEKRAHLPPSADISCDGRQGPRVLLSLDRRHGSVDNVKQVVLRVEL
jgi:hypothetical protein